MASIWGRFMAAGQAAYRAFYEPGVITDPVDFDGDFADFDYRRLRYRINWAFYENAAYQKIHAWSNAYKTNYGLYEYVRNIYNPSYRVGEFWKAHLWGGYLDPMAGDGVEVRSALPIITDNEALRPAISTLWQWSNWQINKDIITLYGTVLGDVFIQVIDDPMREKVYLKILHPGVIKSIELDDFGNVKGYTIEEERPHPEKATTTVTYSEVASRNNTDVVYRTFLNGTPYAWTDAGAEWTVPYGFVPLVMIRHNDVGLDWGWAELHAARSKIHEVDDQASKLDDYIRKLGSAPMLYAGIPKKKETPQTTKTELTGAAAIRRPQPGREEYNALYAIDPNAKAMPAMVTSLDLTATGENMNRIIQELERDYPEMRMDLWNAQGDTSGVALRTARQPVEKKAELRRPNYDNALVRAQMMAIAIGGERGYFDGFSLDSYAMGDLDHSIGLRPVFGVDPLVELEMETKRLQVEIQRSVVAREAAMGSGEGGDDA